MDHNYRVSSDVGGAFPTEVAGSFAWVADVAASRPFEFAIPSLMDQVEVREEVVYGSGEQVVDDFVGTSATLAFEGVVDFDVREVASFGVDLPPVGASSGAAPPTWAKIGDG